MDVPHFLSIQQFMNIWVGFTSYEIINIIMNNVTVNALVQLFM